MGWPVVTVASGGLPVTDATASGFGTPVEIASNGFGTPVTFVSSGGIPVLGGASAPVLPTGAFGIWDTSSGYVSTPRKTIKNSVTNGTTDANQYAMPRRNFRGSALYYTPLGLTVTDEATTAPDGTGEASTITNAVVGYYQLEANANVYNPAQSLAVGTYTLCCSVKSLSGASQNFLLRATNTTEFSQQFTATTAWQRFAFTFHVTGSPQIVSLAIQSPVDAVVNLAIIDFELFAGSADLNAHPLTAAPLMVQNGDIALGQNNFLTTASVSVGLTSNTTLGFLSLPAAKTLTNWTIAFAGNPTAAPSLFSTILSRMDDWFDFGVGPYVNSGPTYPASLFYNNNSTQAHVGQINAYGVSGSSWGIPNAGAHTFIVRYDGTNVATFVNGMKVQEGPATLGAAQVIKDLVYGAFQMGNTSGYQLGFLAAYTRSLSNVEVQAAHSYMVSKVGAVGVKRILGVTGDSITALLPTWMSIVGPNLSPPRLISSQATPSQTIALAITSQVPYLDPLLTNGPAQTGYALYIGLGTNDLMLSGLTPAQVISALQSFIDARRTAGWQKIIMHTILPRADAGAYTEANFNTARATVNAAIVAGLGSRLDAVADWAANATMGANGACNNATNYQADLVHPTAAGQVILEPISRAAINSV